MKRLNTLFGTCLSIKKPSKNRVTDFLIKFFGFSASLFLISNSVFAAAPTGAGGSVLPSDWIGMLENFASQFPDIEKMITAAAYVLGFAFLVRGVYYLKVYGEARTMMSSNSSLRAPLTYFLVAIAFIYLPSTIDVVLATVYNSTEITPISYTSESGGAAYGEAIKVFYLFIQLIGYVAFIRGWIIISHTAQQGGRETIGKGITHILGGILAINVVATKDILWNTFGFPTGS